MDIQAWKVEFVTRHDGKTCLRVSVRGPDGVVYYGDDRPIDEGSISDLVAFALAKAEGRFEGAQEQRDLKRS